jgi:hypothetical protein
MRAIVSMAFVSHSQRVYKPTLVRRYPRRISSTFHGRTYFKSTTGSEMMRHFDRDSHAFDSIYNNKNSHDNLMQCINPDELFSHSEALQTY